MRYAQDSLRDHRVTFTKEEQKFWTQAVDKTGCWSHYDGFKEHIGDLQQLIFPSNIFERVAKKKRAVLLVTIFPENR